MSERNVRVGIDVGGTFTDFVVADLAGGAASFKVPSTTRDPATAVLEGLHTVVTEYAAPAEIDAVVHGTTIGLNSIVQRTGAHVGLVVTSGFRDVMQLTQRLPEEYNLRQPHLPSLVAREDILEFSARLDPHGTVLARPDAAELDRVAERLRRLGVQAVAVSVLHGYTSPAFEAELAEELSARLGGMSVSSAAAIWPQIREYERAALATINAYISPLMQTYLETLRRGIEELKIPAPLYVTTSGGGCVGVESAIARPVETLLSGPASGVMATSLLSAEAHRDLISVDMGGTSTDISVVVDAEPAFATRSEVGGIPLITPVVDVNAIGTGGGSIIWTDGRGTLRIGPHSSGADPGPIAFGRGGTELTLTDVFLLAGLLSPASFEHRFGALALDPARRAAERIATRLGHRGEDPVGFTAAAVLELSTVLAASELQKMLARHGHTAQQFAIAPFGGAGPIAGSLLADEVGAEEVVVPVNAGTFCALGAAWSDVRRELLRGVGRPLAQSGARIAELASQLHAQSFQWARDQVSGDTAPVRARCTVSLSARYRGQAHELYVPLSPQEPQDVATLADRFHDVHAEAFGYSDPHSPIEAIAVHAAITVPAPGTPSLAALPADARSAPSAGTRRMLIGGAWREVPVLGAADIAVSGIGAGIVHGPAVFDLPDSTVLVPEGWQSGPGPEGSLHLRRIAPSPAQRAVNAQRTVQEGISA